MNNQDVQLSLPGNSIHELIYTVHSEYAGGGNLLCVSVLLLTFQMTLLGFPTCSFIGKFIFLVNCYEIEDDGARCA